MKFNLLSAMAPQLKLTLWIVGILLAMTVIVIAVVNGICYARGKRVSTKVFSTKKFLYIYTIAFIIFLIYALTLIYPFVWMTVNSLKEKLYVREYPFALPKKGEWMWSNYTYVFKEYNIGEMFFNSITLTLGGVFIGTLVTTIAAYVMAKYKFRGREIMHTFIILSMTIPTLGSLPATYKLMVNTELKDTFLGMMLMQSGGFGGHYLYMFAFFKGISWTYAESAMIDGASNWKIFLAIMVPLAMPMITMVMILKTLQFWNDYWMPYLFYSAHPTLAVGLQSLKTMAEREGDYNKLFAAMIVSTVPIIIFYIAFQKRLMSVTIGGGVKG